MDGIICGIREIKTIDTARNSIIIDIIKIRISIKRNTSKLMRNVIVSRNRISGINAKSDTASYASIIIHPISFNQQIVAMF